MDPPGVQPQVADLQAEANRLVAVAVYDRPHEAHLARLRLEAEGIECLLQDEHMGGLTGPPLFAVRVHVRRWQQDRARAVLADCEPRTGPTDWVTGDLEAPRCPRCGSLRIAPERWTAPRRAVRWILLGFPRQGDRSACHHCGHRWTAGAESGTGSA